MTNAAGLASLAGVSLAGIGAGTYPNGIAATFAGDPTYLASSGTADLIVSKADQTITFNALGGKTFGDADFGLTATASSGLAVTFSIVSGPLPGHRQLAAPTGAGSCTVRASQTGDTNFNPAAPVDRSFTIAKAAQTIAFGPLPNKTYGTLRLSSPQPRPPVSGRIQCLLRAGHHHCAAPSHSPAAVHVVVRAVQPGDANFNAAPLVDRSFTVALPDLNVTSITLETRLWNGHVPTSTADAISTYNALPLGVAGYAPGAKTLPIFDNVSNQLTFGGSFSNIGYHHHVAFFAPIAGSLAIRVGADFGGGGTLIVDGAQVQFRNTSMWWGGNYLDPSQYLSGTVTVSAGWHTIDSYGFEDCCDGPQQGQYSYLGAPFKTFSAPPNVVPVVALSGPTSVTVGVANTYTFTVTDPDPGATFTVVSATCGANGTLVSGPTVTPTGGSFECSFPTAGSTSTVAVQVADNLGALSNTATRTVSANKLAQTIGFPAPADTSYGSGDFTISATASSGLPVTVVASGACTASGFVVHVVSAGTCTLTASQAGNATYAAAPAVVRPVAIAKALLTVTAEDKSRPYGEANPLLTATYSGFVNGETLGTSGVSGTPSLSTPATSSSAAGSYAITPATGTLASANYSFAFVAGTLTVSQASQTITFGALAGRTFGDADFAVSAAASSGLAVTFSVVAGPCQVTGNSVHLTGAGDCTIRASQTGDGNYHAATPVDQSFAIGKAAQTITFGALGAKTFGDADFSVTATASSGLAVTFSVVSGPCVVTGSSVHITAAGSCTIRASQAGNDDYHAATAVDQSFAIGKAAQTITFDALAGKTFGDTDFSVTATSSSGLAVTFSIVSGPCQVTGNSVHIIGAGDCTVRASQGGNGNYNAATSVDQLFAIGKAAQTVTFGALGGKTFGDADFTVSATASSGLAVTFSIVSGPCQMSVDSVHLTGAGDCTVRASQAGNDNYNAATPVDRSFTIARPNQTITFGALGGKTFGDADFSVTATASSGLAVTFSIVSGPCQVSIYSVHLTGAGDCTVRASQAGNDNYNAATPVDQSFTIAKADQAVTFGALGGKTFGDVDFTVSATASSGLAVTFSIVSGPCQVTGNSVHITGAGDCTVRASQAGNGNYNAATPVDQSFADRQGRPYGDVRRTGREDLRRCGLRRVGDGPSSGLAVTFSIVSGPCQVTGNSVHITGAGDCTVRASHAGNGNYNAATPPWISPLRSARPLRRSRSARWAERPSAMRTSACRRTASSGLR